MTFQIDEITLYKSGLGFFNGICKEKEFVLPVNEDVVDDILKSLAIDGLKSVTFSAAETKEDIRRKIGINVDSESAFLSFGQHLIGLEVNIIADREYTGSIVGIDYIIVDNNEDEESGIDVLVLKKENQVQHIPVSEIKSLKILDEIIKKDLEVFLNLEAITRKAGVTNLKILTEAADAKIQWVSPVSAWRLSYRVQYDEEKKKANFLGIAIVDNTTSIDWEKVTLRLVTGRPVSFKYDLHTPLYINRPWIQRDEQGIAPIMAQHSIPTTRSPAAYGRVRDKVDATTSYEESSRYTTGRVLKLQEGADWGVSREVIATEVQGAQTELAKTVIYQVMKPININRSESSLIPLFSKSNSGEQCIVIREDRIDEAMDALIFKKSLELEKGVATIYIDDIFAGDAMIIRGSDYIAYRLNQDVKMIKEVETKNKVSSISIKRNIMYQKHKNTMKYTFKILNISDKKVPLILEITKSTNYKPKAAPNKETANYHRYRFDLEPGTTEKTFTFEYVYTESVYIRDLSETSVQHLIKEGILDDKNERIVMRIFNNLKKMRQKEIELSGLNEEINFVFKNQERLRENIKSLQEIQQDTDRDEYIQRLKESEQLLENLEAERKQLSREVDRLRDKI